MKLKRILFFIFLFFCIATFTVACKKPATAILFNKDPITRETIMNTRNNFQPGQRIYYIFISEKPIVADMVRVQIFKFGDNGAGPSELVSSNDYKVHLNEYYYFTDYVVLSRKGHYFMQIFARDQLYKALARADFYVTED